MDQQKLTALNQIDSVSGLICDMSDAIWDAAELAYQETKSVQVQIDTLKALGFEDIRTQLCNIPTAFSARWGSGRPIIGFLGEFDALSALSQKAGVLERDPVLPGASGHGCGHNLLGSGSIAAAYAVKEYLKATGMSGTVVYFGCPAEESGSAKAFMARDGAFDELDAALSWHPAGTNALWSDGSLANFAVKYRFTGVSAHAATSPHQGRSALDAVELMNVGVQFLREHVPTSVRMHYAITDAGGIAPNVVQPKAEVSYLLRAPTVAMVQEVYARVNDIARGAALMTGTTEEIQLVKCASNTIPNATLNQILQRNLESIPLPELTQEELDFAQAVYDSVENKVDPYANIMPRLTREEQDWLQKQTLSPMCRCIIPAYHDHIPFGGSTDVGDASWATPTAQVRIATWSCNTPGHSWQATAQGKGSIAHKHMLYAGKVLAGAAIDLLNDPQAVANAREDYNQQLDYKPFVSPLPKDIPVPLP